MNFFVTLAILLTYCQITSANLMFLSAQPSRGCASIFAPKPVRTQWRIDYKSPIAVEVVAKIPRIQGEWPSQWVRIQHDYAEISIPKNRWMEVFAVKFDTVVKELNATDTYLVDIFKAKRYSQPYRREALLYEFGSTKGTDGVDRYFIRFNPEIARLLIKMENPEPVLAAIYLRDGIFKSVEWSKN